jgi:hypothetical protein
MHLGGLSPHVATLGIQGCGFQFAVTQQGLEHADINPRFQQVGRKGVPARNTTNLANTSA